MTIVDHRKRYPTRHRGIYYRLDARGRRRYIVWFEGSDGKGHTETLPAGANEQDALSRQAELRGRISRGERVVPTRLTVAEALDAWWEDRGKIGLAPKTVQVYESAMERQLKPRIGRRRLSELGVDDVAAMIAAMQKDGLKAWTIRGALSPLSGMVRYAIRKGWLSHNPVRDLDRNERPKSDQQRMRILSSAEIQKLLDEAPEAHRTLLSTAVFTGMRKGELLALRWSDIDFVAGLITVGDSKTEAGEDRRVVLIPSLTQALRAHKLASGFSKDEDLVFASRVGTALQPRNVTRDGLEKALERAKLEHIRFHDLRHTFASLLIGQGQDVTFVSDQLGHANPQITLKVYAKLFDPARRRAEAREKLQDAFGGMIR